MADRAFAAEAEIAISLGRFFKIGGPAAIFQIMSVRKNLRFDRVGFEAGVPEPRRRFSRRRGGGRGV
jgi:hypothetical protein